MKTAVIIPNYNGHRFLSACMDALDKQSTQDFYIVIVDNASTDGSIEWLLDWQEEDVRRRFIIRNTENLGFSGAVNPGIEWAACHGCSYAVLLNNDTAVYPDFVEQLELSMERDTEKKLFAVSSRMVKMHNEAIIDDAGDQYTILGWQFQRGLGESSERFSKPAYVFSACAGAAIYRISAFKELGLFDIRHFAYLEDVDISYRAQLKGYRILYQPDAICRHVGSGSSGGKYSSFKLRLSGRNSIYLLYKNMPLPQLILNSPFLLAGYLVKLLFFTKKGYGRDYGKGILEGIKELKCLERVDFQSIPLHRFIAVELMLLFGTIEYAMQLFRRLLKK